MSSISTEQLLAQLRWRYSVKTFDASRIIPSSTWDALEESLVLTASSYGLQPWKFLVIVDRALRERLVEFSWGQRQVVDCSHLVVCCIRRDLGEAEIDEHIRRVSDVRGTPLENLAGYRKSMIDVLVKGPVRPMIDEWAARQVYIALGNFMTAAALLGVDTCPMEGFQPPKYDEILGLAERKLTSVVCCAAGYRASYDRHARLPKVRFPREQIIERR